MQALMEILACGGVPDWTVDLLCSYLSNPRISLENPGPCISDEMDVIVVIEGELGQKVGYYLLKELSEDG